MSEDWHRFGSYADRLREKLKRRLVSETTNRSAINQARLKADRNPSINELYPTPDVASQGFTAESESNGTDRKSKEKMATSKLLASRKSCRKNGTSSVITDESDRFYSPIILT